MNTSTAANNSAVRSAPKYTTEEVFLALMNEATQRIGLLESKVEELCSQINKLLERADALETSH